MESERFDALTARLTTRLSRRRSLGVLGLLGLRGMAPGDDATAKHKKKKKKVTLCLNGQTVTVPKKQQGKYRSQGATAGACPGGGGGGGGGEGCRADADCDRCARETCQAGVCTCPAAMSRDANGVCGPPPACATVGQSVATRELCCSGAGNPLPSPPGGFFCIPGKARCQQPADCAGGGGCRGFLCPGPYVRAVGSGCGVETCAQRQECASARCDDGVCVACTSNGDCGSDDLGACTCHNGTCSSTRNLSAPSCTSCPAGTAWCLDLGGPVVACFVRCGA